MRRAWKSRPEQQLATPPESFLHRGEIPGLEHIPQGRIWQLVQWRYLATFIAPSL
jgi:hypothetical protein